MAIDYSDHKVVLALLAKDQEPEVDNRARVRENHHFIEKEDGQWETSISEKLGERPQYTFDMVKSLLNQIVNEMANADFSVRVRPAGGDASKDTANIFDGLIRNIENLSNADRIYNAASYDLLAGGLGGWEIAQDWGDTDSFDQDLFIKPISDYENRVWFDQSAELPTMEDADHVTVLSQISPTEYKERFPEGKQESLTVNGKEQVYYFTPDLVTVGRILWKKPIKKKLVMMSNGAVYERDEKFEKIKDELAEQGITVERERTRNTYCVYSRLFDGGGWLDEARKTVFDYLPVIPVFGGFRISDGKVIYDGFVQDRKDAQRVFNYVKSREVETAALSPRPAFWATEENAEGHGEDWATMNTNTDPVRFFNPDAETGGMPPQWSGSMAVDQGMMALSGTMQGLIEAGAGLYGLNQGNQQGAMSGVAIQSLQNKGDNGTAHWFDSMKTAITHTGKVLVNAIPKVYDSQRMIRIIGEDGTEETVTINERIFDQESQEFVEVNDLTKGQYDATCDVGPAFKNRQQESIEAFRELATIIPNLAEITADIQLQNIPTPGMDKAAARVRQQLVMSGVIPEDQLTDEEKEQIAIARQQPQQPTPDQMIAHAEIGRVQAETDDIQSKAQERADKIAIEEMKLMLKKQEQDRKAQQDQLNAMVEGMTSIVKNLNLNADTLGKLKDVAGAEAIMSPSVIAATQNQLDIIGEQQEQLD